jgi:acetolactate synthase small subunit
MVLVDIFRAKVVDISEKTLTIEVKTQSLTSVHILIGIHFPVLNCMFNGHLTNVR